MSGPEEAEYALSNHGPILIGTVFNILLFGIMITQVYIYYTSYSRDKLFLKVLVLAVFLVDTINIVFDVIYIYVCLILHFGEADYLKVANWQFITDPALTGVISLMVQLFFAWRISVLTRNLFLVAIVVAPALASGTCAFWITWKDTITPQFAKIREFKGVVIVWLACAAAADITITTILVWHLHKTGFKESDMIIDRIIRLTVQTGLITSVVASVNLTVYLTDSSGLHLLFNFALCKLYSNSLMSSLNARDRWRCGDSMLEHVFSERHGLSDNHDITSSRRQRHKTQSILDPTRAEVFIRVESHEMRDVELPGKDLHVEQKVVPISGGPDYGARAQTKKTSILSLSGRCEHEGPAV